MPGDCYPGILHVGLSLSLEQPILVGVVEPCPVFIHTVEEPAERLSDPQMVGGEVGHQNGPS